MRTFIFRTLSVFLVGVMAFAPAAEAASATSQKLRDAYEDRSAKDPIRILIVPGHEPGYGGAVFRGTYEREIVTDIAEELEALLDADQGIEVIVTRDDRAWSPTFKKYFDRNGKKIESFVEKAKKDMAKKQKGKKNTTASTPGTHVEHAAAPQDVALRLYGINKWANENKIDLVLNLHVNDTTDHGPDTPGSNSGFAIYIPDTIYSNSRASRPVAQAIASRLNQLSATSTLRIENQGVVPDRELIAIGAYNTLKVPTALIEYGYITESKFLAPELRSTLAKDYAYQTYLGLRDFFKDSLSTKYPTKTLPRTFSNDIPFGTTSADAYALQVALTVLGFYPPRESTLVSCPVSGVMNECTQVALRAFQKSRGILETGMLDARTRTELNARIRN